MEGRFGISVAVDGDTALVGAFLYDEPVPGAASDVYAYVFVRDETNWIEKEKLIMGSGASIITESDFVGISGCTAIVGTELDDDIAMDAGAAHGFILKQCPCTEPVTGLVSWWTLDELSSP